MIGCRAQRGVLAGAGVTSTAVGPAESVTRIAVQVTWGFEQHYDGVVSDQQRPKCVLEPFGRPEELIRTLLDGLLKNVTALQARAMSIVEGGGWLAVLACIDTG